MRICLIGEFSGHLDEGMRILSSKLAEQLSREQDIKTVDIREIGRSEFWRSIRDFSPDIVHYIHGPSIASLLIVKIIGWRNRNAKTIVSATHPHLPAPVRCLIPLLKPTLILTQSYDIEKMFVNHGCRTDYVPAGVDTGRFRPVSTGVKQELRQKYRIDGDRFVVLHVGSVRKERNVMLLGDLQGDDYQIVFIGSGSTGVEQDVLLHLRQRGCLVWTDYFKNVEEMYALADCYLFPTRKRSGAIESPFSVLEAMACNLPVISTPFGALPRLFQPGEGLFFAENDREFGELLRTIRGGTIQVNTRDKVLPYSWDNMAAKLEDIYRDLLRDSRASAT